jgi:hypothetical protein
MATVFVAIAAAMIAMLVAVPLAVVFVACSNWQGQPADEKGPHGSNMRAWSWRKW